MLKSRKSMHSVMAHSGFGPLTIYKDDVVIEVPQKFITKKGTIRKNIQKLISSCTSTNDYIKLLDIGINVTVR